MVLELLGAPRCAGCASPAGPLCDGCADRLRPISASGATYRVLAGCAYEGPARSLVLGLKLRAARGYAGPLADLCVNEIHRAGVLAEVVTWVPGRRRETRRRGFDHAEEIARRIAMRIGLPARALLGRRGHTTDQTKLGRAERLTNLQGAFESKPVSAPVLLVDDLYTTGATAAVCGRALSRAGAPDVEVVVACRA